jgi:hypothetical protein
LKHIYLITGWGEGVKFDIWYLPFTLWTWIEYFCHQASPVWIDCK